MTHDDSVSLWIDELKHGESEAARRLWDRYFHRLVGLARTKLVDATRRAADEEDVALSAFDSFFRGVERGRFEALQDRDDLWRLLAAITARKAAHQRRDLAAQKRGGGRVAGESALDGGDGRFDDASQHPAGGFDRLAGDVPTPEFVALVAEQIRRRLERLPEEMLRTIALAKLEGYGNQEIADRLGVAPRTVERKLQWIREIWEASVGDGD